MNISRKPESQRGPQLARSANATAAGIRVRLRAAADGVGRPRRAAPARPRRRWRRRAAGSRMASTVATTNSRNA